MHLAGPVPVDEQNFRAAADNGMAAQVGNKWPAGAAGIDDRPQVMLTAGPRVPFWSHAFGWL
jgi:hypothetical protein